MMLMAAPRLLAAAIALTGAYSEVKYWVDSPMTKPPTRPPTMAMKGPKPSGPITPWMVK